VKSLSRPPSIKTCAVTEPVIIEGAIFNEAIRPRTGTTFRNSYLQSTFPVMKLSSATLIAFAAGAIGAPTESLNPRQAAPGACSSAVKLDAKTNVWTSYTLHPNSFYRAEVEAAAAQMSGDEAARALKVADVGTFLWAYVESRPRLQSAPEVRLLMYAPETRLRTLTVSSPPCRMCHATTSLALLSTTCPVAIVPPRPQTESFLLVL
jgi:hypothetical protein